MSYNKFIFESIDDFKTAQRLASQSGIKTVEQFNKYLEANYNQNKK